MNNEQIIFEDNFDGQLDNGWSWLREHPADWRIQNNGLEICVRPGVKDTVQNALLRPSPNRNDGAYAFEVTITNHTHPTQQYEQAGITYYHNSEPVFKEVKERIDGDLYIIPGRKPMPTPGVRLRLILTANSWEAQYRPEGETEFLTAADGELPSPGDDQVSIQCYNGPPDQDHWIRFQNFCILMMDE